MKTNINKKLMTLVSSTCLTFALSACTETQLDRLSFVGKEPPISKVEDPTRKPDYAPISWPVPESKARKVQTSGSLWVDGSKAFFKDQRARNIGDILMVKVAVKDSASMENKTETSRSHTDDMDLPGLFGFENKVFDALPGDINTPSNILSTNSTRDSKGDGKSERTEAIDTDVAAVVTQVLPNGNLVISGTQEVRVNFETRQLTVAGIIRPEDISSTNSIELNQIAEARVSYGGKGLITDMQQPRLGSQLVDIISPF